MSFVVFINGLTLVFFAALMALNPGLTVPRALA